MCNALVGVITALLLITAGVSGNNEFLLGLIPVVILFMGNLDLPTSLPKDSTNDRRNCNVKR